MQTPLATNIELRSVASLRPHAGNARRHSKKQIGQIADSIRRFGFTNPVLISDDGDIVAGHGRTLAAQQLGMTSIPTLRLSHLTPTERRAYVLADNKLALNAGWDADLLAVELQGLIDLDFEVDLTGFSIAEIDRVLDDAKQRSPVDTAPEDVIPVPPARAVSRPGDLWHLGRHRLLCGDAQLADHLMTRMAGERAALISTYPTMSPSTATPVTSVGLSIGNLRLPPARCRWSSSCNF
jgi:ParB-like chromosome segregation protein Spo0J